MSSQRLSVQIDGPFANLVSEDWLRKVVDMTLVAAGLDAEVHIDLVIASDDTVRELNRDFRGIDDTTDVLAFALSEDASEAEAFVMPPGTVRHLGEVIVSYNQAERQAKEHDHTLDRELALLVAHGVLHLLGHDHEEPEAEQTMRAIEARVMGAI